MTTRTYDNNVTVNVDPLIIIQWSFVDNSETVQIALFCENEFPDIWCGIGSNRFSFISLGLSEGKMINSQGWTDAVIGYIAEDGSGEILDFKINDRDNSPGENWKNCPNAVCPGKRFSFLKRSHFRH